MTDPETPDAAEGPGEAGPTHMRREIDEIPDALARLAEPEAQADLAAAAAELRAAPPPLVLTVARGSSDHAATYLSYALTAVTGVPVASFAPSLVTRFGAAPAVAGAAALAISQSGRSADLVAAQEALAAGGARTLALTNKPESPLAAASARVVPLRAGPEQAVAATKSFAASIGAGLWLAALWAQDDALAEALRRLPEALATPRPESPAAALFHEASQAVVIARGPGLGLAGEMALKMQETCGIFAAAYSGAEVLHGPSAILPGGVPVLALSRGARGGLDQALETLAELGAQVVHLPEEGPGLHPLVDPLLDLVSLYGAVEAASRARGGSPDRPFHLRKETVTL